MDRTAELTDERVWSKPKPKPTFDKVLKAAEDAMSDLFTDHLGWNHLRGQTRQVYDTYYVRNKLPEALRLHVALKMLELGDESLKNLGSLTEGMFFEKLHPMNTGLTIQTTPLPKVPNAPVELCAAMDRLIKDVNDEMRENRGNQIEDKYSGARALEEVDTAIENAMGVGKSRG